MKKFNIDKKTQFIVVVSIILLNDNTLTETIYNIQNNDENIARAFIEELIEKYSNEYTTVTYKYANKEYVLTNTVLTPQDSKIVIKQISQEVFYVSQINYR